MEPSETIGHPFILSPLASCLVSRPLHHELPPQYAASPQAPGTSGTWTAGPETVSSHKYSEAILLHMSTLEGDQIKPESMSSKQHFF